MCVFPGGRRCIGVFPHIHKVKVLSGWAAVHVPKVVLRFRRWSDVVPDLRNGLHKAVSVVVFNGQPPTEGVNPLRNHPCLRKSPSRITSGPTGKYTGIQ